MQIRARCEETDGRGEVPSPDSRLRGNDVIPAKNDVIPAKNDVIPAKAGIKGGGTPPLPPRFTDSKVMQYTAILLAGGRITGQTIKALIEINGKSCLSSALDALQGSKYINRIIVVGPQEVGVRLNAPIQFIREGKSGEENIFLGANSLDYSGKFIIGCSDMPFICSQDIDAFIELCPADTLANYPIFERNYISQTFPEAKIKYVPLKDGAYTGGNLFLVHTDLFTKYKDLITAGFRARKSQIRMGQLLGLRLNIKFLFRQLTVADIERKVSEILGGKVKAIPNASPNLGMDIDLLREYYIALQMAEKQTNVEGSGS
ncbi:MAG: NTP transferase domain-containing protein [bacterium]|nr:NTP transferase domain-containing protein [bacterium]